MPQGLELSAPAPAEDFSRARKFMVDGQLTPNGITDPLLLGAIAELPREDFLPAGLGVRAYADEAVPLGEGRFMLAPMVLAKMIQMALPQPGDRALVLASGTGYGAAVLARMGLIVDAVESDARLSAIAGSALDFDLKGNRPRLIAGGAAAGNPAGAPYRLILIEGAVEAVPDALTAQLGEGGRIVTVRRVAGGPGRIVMWRRLGGTVSEIQGPDAAATPLADFAPEPGFTF
ncbi:protein-L-isoaspartate O-methyltransferase family protein [Roseococcus sp. YIM B11640]|uniref:protein-L-isoaspartate O-methyltransferase family protein n=1 Tax=Roseococcus sp. YIM B11640 TaxID=3133973 RepID=UPI003C7C0121